MTRQKRQLDYCAPNPESLGEVSLFRGEAAACANQPNPWIPVMDSGENAQQDVDALAPCGAAYVEERDRFGAGTQQSRRFAIAAYLWRGRINRRDAIRDHHSLLRSRQPMVQQFRARSLADASDATGLPQPREDSIRHHTERTRTRLGVRVQQTPKCAQVMTGNHGAPGGQFVHELAITVI